MATREITWAARDRQLQRSVRQANGRSYTHICTLRVFEEVVWFIEEHPETSTPVNKPTPMPPTKTPASAADEDAAAAVFLSLDESADPGAGEPQGDQTIPVGSTLMGIIPLGTPATSTSEYT
jgi:hypothetical protein